ncbi:hypothetical protein ACFQY7_51295 [Actinomadura luteofluorescens]|uniref:hypothetical protein n=1 Tax=Actinomadura luteofluorescens TaxID=46163 RepID=UPI00362B3B6E
MTGSLPVHTTRSPKPCTAPSTSIRPRSRTCPRPRRTVTPSSAIRATAGSSPRLPARPSRRARAISQVSPRRADSSSDLDGTHAKYGDSPPTRRFSTSATSLPARARPVATSSPAVPPPSTTAS